MILKISKTLFFLILLSTHLSATADGPDYWRVINVAPNDVLWMHPKPNHRSPKIAKLPYNARGIQMIECQWISQKSKWCKIAYHEEIGWVNARYLGEDS